MPVAQIKTTWSGGPSSPGLTIFNVDAGATLEFGAAAAAVASFFTALKGGIPDEYTLQVDSLIEMYDPVTGTLSGEASLSTAQTPAAIVGTGTGGYAHGVGKRVDWITSTIRNGRRVRGRTFIVPSLSVDYGTDGKITAASVTALGNAAATLLTSLDNAGTPLAVWSRPTAKGAANGALSDVIGYKVPDKAAVLRGRRD